MIEKLQRLLNDKKNELDQALKIINKVCVELK